MMYMDNNVNMALKSFCYTVFAAALLHFVILSVEKCNIQMYRLDIQGLSRSNPVVSRRTGRKTAQQT